MPDLRRSQVHRVKSGIFLCEWHKKFAGPTEKQLRGALPLGSPLYGSRIIRQNTGT